jgi:hypothetical protein
VLDEPPIRLFVMGENRWRNENGNSSNCSNANWASSTDIASACRVDERWRRAAEVLGAGQLPTIARMTKIGNVSDAEDLWRRASSFTSCAPPA